MKWKCRQCRCVVECDTKPSDRYEPVLHVPVGADNRFVGVPNNYHHSSANHYGPICFGPEWGEDYYQHEWQKVKEEG